jgi:hypothetical protein
MGYLLLTRSQSGRGWMILAKEGLDSYWAKSYRTKREAVADLARLTFTTETPEGAFEIPRHREDDLERWERANEE